MFTATEAADVKMPIIMLPCEVEFNTDVLGVLAATWGFEYPELTIVICGKAGFLLVKRIVVMGWKWSRCGTTQMIHVGVEEQFVAGISGF